MAPSELGARSGGVQSVDRAVSILEMLAVLGDAGVSELATELDLHKSTVFRLLTTLEARGLVARDIERGRYRIGATAVQLATAAQRGHDIAVLGRPICRELVALVGESVHLAVRDGDEVITVEQVVGRAAVTAVDWVGKRQPLHATAAGKVFLAAMPPPELDRLLQDGLARHTRATVTDPQLLRAQLRDTGERGYATTYEEHEEGLSALAAPVRGLGGQVIAALTVSGPTFRVHPGTLPGLLEQLTPAAIQLSWRCGHIKRG